MTGAPLLAAVDWGSSRFRLWMLSRDRTVLGHRQSEQGVAEIAEGGFQKVLEQHLASLAAPSELPVLICGMAGSRQGWLETGYIDVPADLSELASLGRRVPATMRRVTILPGISSGSTNEPDVMRGEETRLYGASLGDHDVGSYCLPGSHSRWVTMEGSRIVRFRTFMTGDLFQATAGHTILRHCVGTNEPVQANDPAFLTGVRDGWLNAARLTQLLFDVRGGYLLDRRPPAENQARLSGLLIGAELAGADVGAGEGKVGLVASGHLARLYQAALTACGASVRLIDADHSVQRGLFEAFKQSENL